MPNLIRYILAATTVLLIACISYSQNKKPFTGMLEYKISVRDTSLQKFIPDNAMRIYTNDTIVRMENFSQQLGSQTTIRHSELNKSYLLLTVHDTVHFAIKTDLNIAKSDTSTSKYTYEKKWFKRKHLGMRAKRMIVNHPDFKEPIEFLYLKKYSRKYLNNFEGIPGLLVKYSVVTPDAILDYELVEMREFNPNRDLFGIPAEYKKVTFDEFMDYMFPHTAPQNQPEGGQN